MFPTVFVCFDDNQGSALPLLVVGELLLQCVVSMEYRLVMRNLEWHLVTAAGELISIRDTMGSHKLNVDHFKNTGY